ncbi:hypothetical protein HYW84_03150 [Candidatus Peregrinibacteria bacterium]|nr:hypothetical protein [Candidatus Peregrinibacteria bacterium]
MNVLMWCLRRPYILALAVLIVLSDAVGVVHSYRMHGKKDMMIAVALPPYGVYRAAEAVTHRKPLTDDDIERLSHTRDGRDMLTRQLRLSPAVWNALLGLIGNDLKHEFRTTMKEADVPFTITANVPDSGPVGLMVQGGGDPDFKIVMSDADRDQRPEKLTITKMMEGKPEVRETTIEEYNPDDASQFLFAWALAWGTIAEELKGTAFLSAQ